MDYRLGHGSGYHEGYAILTFQDVRLNDQTNIVAYRISPEGYFIWGDNGIMLSENDAFEASPKVIISTANNAVFAWPSASDAGDAIITQKITPLGVKQWGDWGITHTTEDSYTWPQLIPAGEDDIIMKYYHDTGPWNAPTRHILAQRFGNDGQPVWD